MKNYIGLNIKYLYEENKLTQNEFGELFGLKNGVVGTYVRGKTNPQIETIQKICEHFNVSLDDFINQNLRTLSQNKSHYYIPEKKNIVAEPVPGLDWEKHYKEWLADKDKIIEMLQEEVRRLKGGQDYNSKTA